MNPNKQQKKLIESTEGVYLVDAGAGTGKTFSITRRYLNILEDSRPEDIFLATFTRNAAEEMSDRIASESSYKASKIYNAPISTFHSHCQKILERHGFYAPKKIGIDDELENIDPLESKIREQQFFNDFYGNFRANNPEYLDFYVIIQDENSLLSLLKSLASRGVIPEKDGWFLNSEEYLDGSFEEFRKVFKKLNMPRETDSGKKQSILRQRMYSYNYKDLSEDAPEYNDIVGDYGCKQVRKDFCKKSFQEDRERLKDFVHKLYFNYIKYCLENNYLNFGLLMALTYVTLYTSEEARENEQFNHIMIDEFQDTNEIQLKISLLLAERPNICVVGDWKQSIYSFQYADIDNIKRFQKRMNSYINQLNGDEKRVNFGSIDVEKINLVKNYRSSQAILDASEQAFTLKGNRYETVPEPDIVSLESEASISDTEIVKYSCEDEKRNLLAKIQTLSNQYDYSDIAVLSRTRRFGLELQDEASEFGIPVAYEGGVELFNTEEAKILLAWLRALRDSRKGWAVILERTGYSMTQARKIFDQDEIPENLLEFRDSLKGLEIESVMRKVFSFYGFENSMTEKIVEVIVDTYTSSFMTESDLIQFIEDNISEGEIYEVDTSRKRDCVKIQTVHGAKGLEYPIVFVSDVNYGVFPSKNSSYSSLSFDEVIGLRQRKIFDQEKGYVFDNWKAEILSKCVGGRYDEERRLMYVAMTRAEEKLYITSEKGNESRFYDDLDLKEEYVEVEPETVEEAETERAELKVASPESSRRRLVSTSEEADLDEKMTSHADQGDDIHRFAENYIKKSLKPENSVEKELAEFIDSLEGKIESEVSFSYPDQDSVITGRVDILAITDSKVKVIDIKSSDNFKDSYEEQMELYHKAFEQIYPDKKIVGSIFEV